jgi:maltooligosyltrehalose trehalohydrolase
VIDTVLNHFGPEGAYVPQLGPYLTDRHITPWGAGLNLDGEASREVRRFLIDVALAWLRDYGADGLRLDAVHALRDDSERHLVAELVDEVRALSRELGRSLVVIGEYDDHDPVAVIARDHGGWGLDAHWNDDFHHAVHTLLTGERAGYYADFAEPDTLRRVLERGYALDGRMSQFRGRPHGYPYGTLPRDRLIAYVQSHDQVGNRPAGERLHQLAGYRRARLAAALLFTSPFVPMVFQGEEWAASTPFCYFAQPESPALCDTIREGRRAEHAASHGCGEPIDPIDPATRDRCVLRWDERAGGEHATTLAWYRALIAARRAYPALRDPDPHTTTVTRDGDVLQIERGNLVLACNLADEPRRIERTGEVILTSDGAGAPQLPALGCVLLRG